MSKLSTFNEHFQKTLTLRNELVPVGKTLENIISSNVLINDEKRSEDYKKAKEIIDSYHRNFIEKSLSSVNVDWNDLYLYLSKKEPEDYDQKQKFLEELENILLEKRKIIVKQFEQYDLGSYTDSKSKKTKDLKFENLFKAELFDYLLPNFLKNDEDKKVIGSFNKFTSYFTGFYENRKNLYKSDPLPTAVAYRIVNENFPKFISNKNIFRVWNDNVPQFVEIAKTKLIEAHIAALNIESKFELSNFNSCLNQTGIDTYNDLIGQLNFAINLECQKDKNLCELLRKKRSLKMAPLYKQILSDKDSSFSIDEFDNDESAIKAVISFYKKMVGENCPQRTLSELLHEMSSHDLEKIFVQGKNLNSVSKNLFGGKNWSFLRDAVIEEKSKEKGFKRVIKSNSTAEELDKVLSKAEFSISFLSKVSGKDLSVEIDKFVKNQDEQLDEIKSQTWPISLKKSEEKNLIKAPLDFLLNFYRFAQSFSSNNIDKDMSFYADFDLSLRSISDVIGLYNKVRNYATKKPYTLEKIKLNFENPNLASGWSESKENDCLSIILLKEKKYFLGIFNKNNKPDFSECISQPHSSNGCYRKMRYLLFKGFNKMLPKCAFTGEVKEHFKESSDDFSLFNKDTFVSPLVITKEIFDLACSKEKVKKFQKEYEKINRTEYRQSLIKWIAFGLKFLSSYKTTSQFDLSNLKRPEEYSDLKEFYEDVDNLTYKIEFLNIKEEYVDTLVENGQLYLFEIRNKDFAKNASGTPNLHTLYFKSIFDLKNLENGIVKLNGEAEIFYRKKSLKKDDITVHREGSYLVNKVCVDPNSGKSEQIPDKIYENIYAFVNGKSRDLSKEDEVYYAKSTIKKATHEIVKDRRFTVDKFFFHCPITINYKSKDKPSKFNDKVLDFLRNNKDINIMGIDRGERNLIYATVINQNGEIVDCKTFNTIKHQSSSVNYDVDYHNKLKEREKSRKEEKRSWNSITKIADLKEGYLSAVIHEISLMMVKYNAIVVMENLNQGFKRIRCGIAERAVYQKFEKMLIDKLNYFVIKNETWTNPGGVLNGYQLTNKVSTIKDIGNQCGFLFYVPAAYTSKIDPSTGFVNLLNFNKYKNSEERRKLICSFDNVCFVQNEDLFKFSIDYGKLCPDSKVPVKKWDIFSYGTRIVKENLTSGHMKENPEFDPTEELKTLLSSSGIEYQKGQNLLETISTRVMPREFWNSLFKIFKAILQMRNSLTNSPVDRLLSPVKGKDGTFFDTDKVEGTKFEKLKDADANGAYNIALKGLLVLDKNDSVKSDKDLKNVKKISLEDWLKFVQISLRS